MRQDHSQDTCRVDMDNFNIQMMTVSGSSFDGVLVGYDTILEPIHLFASVPPEFIKTYPAC